MLRWRRTKHRVGEILFGQANLFLKYSFITLFPSKAARTRSKTASSHKKTFSPKCINLLRIFETFFAAAAAIAASLPRRLREPKKIGQTNLKIVAFDCQILSIITWNIIRKNTSFSFWPKSIFSKACLNVSTSKECPLKR